MAPSPFSALLLAVFALSCAALHGQTPAPAVAPDADIVVLHDVVIGKGGGRDLHAEIAYPKNATVPLMPVIFIHGGGWIAGDNKRSPIELLAKAGFFAASIEYRLSNEAKWPAQIQDCKLAVRWLRANAAKYNLNPDRIGVMGESAGGHLVACLGTMADVKEYEGDGGYPGVSSAVQAVVDFYGPTDFTQAGIYSADAIKVTEMLFGAPYAQNPDLWKSGSPLYYVKAGDPPVLMVHGDKDGLVPIAQSEVFDAALTKAGVPHQLIVVKNGNHGFIPVANTVIEPSRADINKYVVDFFYQYLKGP
jgi:acetyl esterase/lipase